MTQKKQLKVRVRARMARTGESYVTALRHATSARQPSSGTSVNANEEAARSRIVDQGYALRGGVHPESANITHILDHHGIAAAGPAGARPISEALVFGIGGGLGAGYILWEFKRHSAARLVMAFHNEWQYPDRWHEKTLGRLGIEFSAEHTASAPRAARRLTELLAAGRPCIVRPDRFQLGYWRMPDYEDGMGGPDLVVYAEDAAGVHLDDRNVSPLIVPRDRLDSARARVGSYRNSLYAIDPGSGTVSVDTLRSAVKVGLGDCVSHLSAPSESFSLPAWRKWGRLLTDERNPKAWPLVFRRRHAGLAGALLAVWENVSPAGGYGGHLRDLYADFLDEAAGVVENERLRDVAAMYRIVSEDWRTVAETALPDSVPAFARLRDLSVAVRHGIVDPAAITPEEADGSAAELWRLRAQLDRELPLSDADVASLFDRLSTAVDIVYTRETAAVAELALAVGTG